MKETDIHICEYSAIFSYSAFIRKETDATWGTWKGGCIYESLHCIPVEKGRQSWNHVLTLFNSTWRKHSKTALMAEQGAGTWSRKSKCRFWFHNYKAHRMHNKTITELSVWCGGQAFQTSNIAPVNLSFIFWEIMTRRRERGWMQVPEFSTVSASSPAIFVEGILFLLLTKIMDSILISVLLILVVIISLAGKKWM